MKKSIIIILILCVSQIAINIFFWQKDSKKSISLQQKGWATNVTFEVADAVLRFRRDKNRMPSSIAEMRPSYLPDPDILFPRGAKKIMGLANVTLKDNPEALDIGGSIKIFFSPRDDSFYVILSPLFFGSDHIPVRHWRSNEQTFNILTLQEIKNLTINHLTF